jgi:hypothetical protein
MPEKRRLRVIEVKDGQLPPGINGEDITGPIVLMEDGKLPPGVSEDHLIEIGATVLAVKSGEPLPLFISETNRLMYLEWGISEGMLEQAGYIPMSDAVVEKGRADTERIIAAKVRSASEEDIVEHLAGLTREIKRVEELLATLRRWKSDYEKLLAEKRKSA